MAVEASATTEPRTAGSTTVVGVFKTHRDAEAAIKALEAGGCDMRTLSLVGKGFHSEQHPIGYYNAGDRMKHWGKLGAFWGGVWGLLVGSAFFWIPGIGPLLLGGPLVSVLVGALEGAVIVGGLSALGAALYSMGIPKNSVIEYETAIKADKYLLIDHGPSGAVPGIRDLIQRAGAERVDVHEK
jgi:hypothetical protein